MKNVTVVVNHLAELTERQTTSLLIASFVRLGCQVMLASVDGLSLRSASTGDAFRASGLEVPRECDTTAGIASFVRQGLPLQESCITADDLVVIRTNPGRDAGRRQLHQTCLHLLEIAQTQGLQVINSPGMLTFFANKASLSLLDPRFRPPMVVSSQAAELHDFILAAPDACVVKPLWGSRGAQVIRVQRDTPNLLSKLTDTFHGEPVIAQHFVHASHAGDRRIVVLDGEILESGAHIAGIERHPAPDDFRANLHAGGTAHPVQLSIDERTAATHAAKLLDSNGIRLAGVDLIGDQVIEFNVFSTGGLFDGNRFAGQDFTEVIARQFLNTGDA